MVQKISEVLTVLEPFKTSLRVTEEGNYILIEPTKYIEPDIYSEIGRIMHGFQAEYVTTTKPKQWRILKAEANPKLSLAVNRVQKAVEYIEAALKELKEAGYGT